jgi:hypothetical protein
MAVNRAVSLPGWTPQTNQCQAPQDTSYSITSSARSRNDSGIVRPSAFAVLRLIASSNLVGCSTGTSATLPRGATQPFARHKFPPKSHYVGTIGNQTTFMYIAGKDRVATCSRIAWRRLNKKGN